jgi:ATP-dependent Zn protease
MTSLESTSITAYHEAGHAVVALALGRPVEKVTIVPNSKRLGLCKVTKGRFRPSADPLETEVMILLAGLVAEARYTGRFGWGGAQQDLRQVRAYAIQRAGSETQAEKLERRLMDKTEHLLTQPGIWPAIERIATELVAKTEISGRAARQFYEEALQQHGSK